MIGIEQEYEISFFKENDFTRRKCEICGTHYWTQNIESRNCGDYPCQEYTFIGNPPTRKQYTLPELRDLFLRYFEKNSHTIIKPYPVIARWRDDVYLVGASIYDFQPYVTEGAIPPPANPLVISQPCIRFTDIDKVGLTFGRHMTIFEMGGAHAFNYHDRTIYWKDETVEFHHELLTRELGVNSADVNYKEDFWSGGGNAGPDFEACVAGLEISTLVFMMYRYLGEKLVEIPVKTVDTGYGIERWTWLSRGSPTGFHAAYGILLDEIINLAGLKNDYRTVISSPDLTPLIASPSTQTKSAAKSEIAEMLGLSTENLDRAISNFQSICTVLDHTKALSFLLSEGVVPSNVQEGYLARLLIRRTYRILRSLGIETYFFDIVERQISHWSRDFPNLRLMKNEIVEELKVEQEKYKRTLDKGAELVKKISRDVRKSGLKEISIDTLIELYDSHGLVPDIVREFAENESVTVPTPEDFFGKVAQKHLDAKPPQETPIAATLKDRVEAYPATKKLYYQDPYASEFKAKVLDVIDGKYVILDQTAFYSEGGGQLADHGVLRFDGGSSKVVDVQSVGNIIEHTIEGKSPEVGSEVQGVIDWDRRLSLMRHHTSTHILIGAARRVLGEHAWQAGAAKDVETSRLDISHHRHLTIEEVNKIEQLACEVVTRNISIETAWMPRDEAEKKYGYRIYQGGAIPGTEIRLVKIGDWDVEACAGTHVGSTGEIGPLKILRTDRIQDGVERLIFASGPQAIKKIQERELELSETAKIMKTSIENLSKTALAITKDMDALAKKIARLREELTTKEAKALLEKTRRIGNIRLLISQRSEIDEEETIMLGGKISKTDPRSVAILILAQRTIRLFVFVGEEAIKAGADAGRLARELANIVGGGGGGRSYFGQGGGTDIDKLQKMTRLAPKIISKQLSKR